MPLLITGQRFGGDHGYHIIRCGVLLKVHHHLHIPQLRRAKGRPAGNPGQLGGAQGKQPLAIAQQQVADAALGVTGAGLGQAVEDLILRRLMDKACPQTIEQIAEDRLAVGITHRLEGTFPGDKVIDLAVMGEGPVLTPQLPGKGMGIGQADPADVGLADMADDVLRLDRITLDQLGNGRAVTGLRIMKAAHPAPFVEGHAPAVTMGPGTPAALHQPGKTEADIRRYVGTHAHQFTHSVTPRSSPMAPFAGKLV